MAEEDEDLEEIKITGSTVFSGGAGFAPFDLGGMAAALDAVYASIAAAAAASYYTPEPSGVDYGPPPDVPEIVVTAPAPRPPVRSDPPPPPVVLPPQPPVAAPMPEETFVFPLPVPEVVVSAPRPIRPPLAAPRPVPIRFGVLGLLAGLVPWYLKVLGDVDAYATDHSLERISGKPPRSGKPGLGSPELPPDRYRYGRPRPWGISGPPLPNRESRPDTRPNAPRSPAAPRGGVTSPDVDVVPEITVTGRAPRPLPAPAWWPSLSPIPGVEATPLPLEVLADLPRPSRQPEVLDAPIPGLPNPIGDPFPELAPAPAPAPAPRPQPPPGIDDPWPGATVPGPGPELATPPAWSRPPVSSDPCNCGAKTKNPKKRKPRTVCFKGTYTERSNGLNKRRKQRVSCSTGKPIGT